MKKNICLLIFFLFPLLSVQAENEKDKFPSNLNLYLCVGQSNMAERARLTQETFH